MNPKFLTNETEIKSWVDEQQFMGDVCALDIVNGVVNCDDFTGVRFMPPLQVQFGEVRIFNVAGCENITSFDGFPHTCEKMYINLTGIRSLVGINDHVKTCSWLSIRDIEEGGLGLLLIKDLTNFTFKVITSYGCRSGEAFAIIKRHLGSKDIFACQQELIDNDLTEFAII